MEDERYGTTLHYSEVAVDGKIKSHLIVMLWDQQEKSNKIIHTEPLKCSKVQ